MLLAAILASLAAADMPVRSCPTHVEGERPGLVRHSTDATTPNIVFHGLRSWARRPVRSTRHGDSIAKAGVSVRAGRSVVVRVARRDRARLALDYDIEDWRGSKRTVAGGAGQPAIRIEPCARDTPRFSDGEPVGEWTGYSGGFMIARPVCATLEIERAGEPVLRRRVGFGRRCGPRR